MPTGQVVLVGNVARAALQQLPAWRDPVAGGAPEAAILRGSLDFGECRSRCRPYNFSSGPMAIFGDGCR